MRARQQPVLIPCGFESVALRLGGGRCFGAGGGGFAAVLAAFEITEAAAAFDHFVVLLAHWIAPGISCWFGSFAVLYTGKRAELQSLCDNRVRLEVVVKNR
jgi:hypothetical protein